MEHIRYAAACARLVCTDGLIQCLSCSGWSAHSECEVKLAFCMTAYLIACCRLVSDARGLKANLRPSDGVIAYSETQLLADFPCGNSGSFLQKFVKVGFQSTKLLGNLFHVSLAAVAIGIHPHLSINENCLQFAANSTECILDFSFLHEEILRLFLGADKPKREFPRFRIALSSESSSSC